MAHLQAKVGIIGPADLVTFVMDISVRIKSEIPNLMLFPYSYQHESEAVSLVNENKGRFDVVLFTGKVPYYLVRESMRTNMPMDFIQSSAVPFIKAFYEYKNKSQSDDAAELKFSIDSLSRQAVDELLGDLEITKYQAYVMEYDGNITSQELFDYHIKLQREGKTDFAVTYLTSTYRALKENGAHAYRVRLSNTGIIEALVKLNAEASRIVSKDAQFCSGVIRVVTGAINHKYHYPQYENRRALLMVMDKFIAFCESLGASFKIENEKELIFVTTRGAMEAVSQNHRVMPFLLEAEKEKQLVLKIGVGYGLRADESEKNARDAVKHSETRKDSNCVFMSDEDGLTVITDGGEAISYCVSSYDKKLIDAAKQCGVSVTTLSKVTGVAAGKKNNSIISNDLSQAMNITPRSARRIMNSLVAGGVATVVGTAQPIGKGRPRQVFKIEV